MSRTIQTIYNEIITEKTTFSSLSGLTSPVTPDTSQEMLSQLSSSSKVAVWRLWAWLMAFAIWTHEQIFDQHVIEIEARALEIIAGTIRWYKNQALLFQHGYYLEWDGDKYVYTDTTSVAALASKIVTQAAAGEVNNQVQIKIAKGTLGALTKLTTAELAAFTSYIDRIKFGGVSVLIINADNDYLKIAYNIEYDPLILTSTGASILDGTFPVADAIDDYIQSLPFNATLKISALTDAIQAVQGVNTAVCTVAEGSSNLGSSYVDILATSTQSYLAYAGYMIIDPAFPLSSQITYIAG